MFDNDEMGSAPVEIGRMSAGQPGLSTAVGIPAARPDRGVLPVLPALRELLPRGGLARGSVVAVAEFGLLALALMVGASADGAWCGGEAAMTRTRWLWLPAEDGSVTAADPADIPVTDIPAADLSSAGATRRLRVVSAR
jgi:hypothetical protein